MSNIYTRLLLNTDKFDKKLFQAQQRLKIFAATSEGVFAGLTKFAGYAAGIAGISTSIHAAVTANMEFEKSLSSLRSLTGVSAQELNYFRAEAVKMAMDSTQSAVAMVDAYKLIGSQMPELLKNKEALSATARAAVTLAEAAEIDVPTAAKALTGSLNQMGASSARASEYINILAAASQQGSADIPYLNRAIENAGGTASAVGVKFNELVAAIEAIAPRITDAGSAGTNLRNIFLTLEASADNNLKPSVVGLSTAIDNLSKKNLNATELTKMFGKESVTAAIALLQEKDAFDQLRVGIEGTNTAYEQAEINTDNLAGSFTKLGNAWTAFINSMSGSNGIIKTATDSLTFLINKANQALLMGKEESKKYDFDKKYGSSAEAVLKNSNEWITQNVEQFGVSRVKAIEDEIEALGRMYPEALKYEQRIFELEKVREFTAPAWSARGTSILNAAQRKDNVAERNAAIKAAEKTADIAERQKYIYDYVLSNLQSQLQAEKDLIKTKEDAVKVEKEKAAVLAAEETKKLAEEKAKRPEGSIADLEHQIKQKKAEINVAISEEDRIRLTNELNALVKEKRYMEVAVQFKTEKLPDINQLKALQDIRVDFFEMTQLPKDLMPKKIEIPSIQKNINEADDYASSIANIASAFGMLSGAAHDDQTAIAQWALQTIGNIANVVSQTMSLAAARAAAGGAQAGFPGMLVAIPTAIAAVISAFTSFPKFADGGIVGGSSYFGDKLLARVNSGELILNQKQQESLYHMTEEDRGGGVTIGFDRVRGSDIYLALKNYMKDTGKKL